MRTWDVYDDDYIHEKEEKKAYPTNIMQIFFICVKYYITKTLLLFVIQPLKGSYFTSI